MERKKVVTGNQDKILLNIGGGCMKMAEYKKENDRKIGLLYNENKA